MVRSVSAQEVLELIGPEQLDKIYEPLFRLLAQCVGSAHFQVAERALFLWNNDHLLHHGCLSRAHSAKVLPLIYGALLRNSRGHWNSTVESLAQNVLKHYMDTDAALFDKCATQYAKEQEAAAAAEDERRAKWEAIMSAGGAV